MKPFKKTAAELFGFDRRERRGTFVLAVLLLVLLLVRVSAFRPDEELSGDEVIAEAQFPANLTIPAEKTETTLFTFDPNTVSLNDLIRIGLKERQARTLINYRTSGARFRKPQDIEKVYGIDSVTASRLIPHIEIVKTAYHEKTKVEATVITIHKAPAAAVVVPPLIDINRCSADDLIQLSGIGPILSARIIRYRGLLGGFISTGQLKEVYGLDSSIVDLISDRLTLTYDTIVPLMLDSCTFSELARHPYIGPAAGGLIIKYRSLMGVSVTLGDLVRQKVMSTEQAARLAPYVRPSPGVTGDEYEFISSKVLK